MVQPKFAGHFWEARYKGECAACPEPIVVGQEIMHADAGGYVHVECPRNNQPHGKWDGTTLEKMGY